MILTLLIPAKKSYKIQVINIRYDSFMAHLIIP
jgi:hypothetical protein